MGIFSTYWYRVENLKPRLRAHARIHRHHYRGERWHIIEDSAAGRYHRFGPDVYYMIALMDGERTVSEIWNAALTRLGDDAPGQNELIMLLSQFHTADLLQCDVTPDSAEVFQRFSKAQSNRWISRIINPMFARFPVWDPDEWLGRWVFLAEKVFQPWVFVVWLVFMAFVGLQASVHWSDLTAPSLSAVLEPMNLLILCITYPLVKILHEMGHAFATRVFGGEVHEVGVMFLIMVPMPYVDASASTAFGSKWKRIIVASAGVMVELFISALALLLWLELAPSFLRTVLWNVMLIGGFSTLFFNGNPLLRFDGYYVLSDLLEIPNLAARSSQYLRYLFEHYVMGLPEHRRIPLAPGERGWLFGYGVLSWIYKISITLGIALYLASQFFFIGVLLALWGLILQLALPAFRGITNLRNDPRVRSAQVRVVGTLISLVVGVLFLIFVVPFPSWSIHEGVVWIPERAQLRAGTGGFVTRFAVAPNSMISPGDVAIETVDPLLDARVRVLEASLAEARAEYDRERRRSVADGRIQSEEVDRIRKELEAANIQRDRALIRANEHGRFVLVERDLEQRFVHRGDVLGYVAQLTDPTVRMVVAQHQITSVRSRLESIEVRLSESPGEVIPAQIDHIVPTATHRLPSMALGAGGGGAIAVDARDPDQLTMSEPHFMVDLALPREAPIHGFGGRVHIRFDYQSEPIFWRAKRRIRRLFMGELGV
jgi:putative peptide zinc metalloprotease protein